MSLLIGVGVRSTEQSVGIKVGGFCPRHHIMIKCAEIVKKTVSAFFIYMNSI